jgi:hypothetical protein
MVGAVTRGNMSAMIYFSIGFLRNGSHGHWTSFHGLRDYSNAQGILVVSFGAFFQFCLWAAYLS